MTSFLQAEQKLLKKVSYNPFSSGILESAVATTEAQREIWATLALNPEATLCYNEALALEISGELDRGILNLAFQEILKRHDALRSVFSPDGKFFFIKEFVPRNLSFLDLSFDSDAEAQLESLKSSLVIKPFDLVNGPCFEGHLVKTSDSHFYLLISAHHIICDGWSFAVLLTEMTTIYSALKKNVQFSYDPASQFAVYARIESQNGLELGPKKYWLGQFEKPLNVKKIPLDFPRPAYRTYDSDRLDFEVPERVVKALKKFGSSQGCSLYTVLMTGFQILLSRLTNSSELVVGMASATQSSMGQHDLVGHLVNLLPLRTEINQDMKLKEFIKVLRSKMLDAFEHQQFSFGTLLKELNFERDPAEIPLVNVVFNIDQQNPDQGLRFDELESCYTTIPRKFENFELFINAVSCQDRLTIECQYNKNLFKTSTLTNWFHCYTTLLENLTTLSETSLGQIILAGLHIPQGELISKAEINPPLIRNQAAEEKLLEIWKEILNLSSIKIHDNFFSLGGHSLLVIEMIPKIEQALLTEVSARDIFENPTIEALAAKIGHPQSKAQPLTKIIAQEKRSTYPVTHNQMQVWYLEQMFPKTTMHNLPSSIRIKSLINREIMEQALHLLTRRHEALRTCIIVEEGIPVQKILNPDLPQFSKKLELITIGEDKIVEALNQQAQYVFDTQKAPLFQAKLYQLGTNDYVLYFMAHHAVWDGWSFDIFFEELNITYSALINGKQPVFEKQLLLSYGDYSLWLQDSVESGLFQDQLDFWKEKLKGPLPILELPTDFNRPLVATHEGMTLPFELKAEQMNHLREYAKKQGTSVFNVILTAFKVTLSRFCHLDDVIVGSPVRARNHADLMNTIGYFVNTVALRTSIDIKLPFAKILKDVSRTCIEAFDHQTLPFQMVLNKVEHPRDSSRTPIFQTFFSYQDVSNREAVLNGTAYSQINIDKASIHTDLDLWIKTSDKKIEGAFEFRKDLFKKESIERFYECFIFLLDHLALNEHAPLLSTAILPPQQSQLILNEWNDTSTEQTSFLPMHIMFAESVRKYPTALAIQNDKGSLTYAELDARSNKVAQGLLSLGVLRGDLVGLSLSRDLNMLVTILGILKTGAGYVPLDPSFPQARLDYMIASSNPKVLVTESSLIKRFELVAKTIQIDSILSDTSLSEEKVEVDFSQEDTAYVIYTSGSTGNPKGVQISHGALSNFLVSMRKAPGLNHSDRLLAVTTLSFDIATLELYLPLITGASIYLAQNHDVIDGKALKNIIEKNKMTVMQATPSTWRLLLAAGWNGSSQFKVLCGGEPFPKDLASKLISYCGSVWNMYGPTETTVWSTCHKLPEDLDYISIGKPIDNTFTYVLDEGLNLLPVGVAGQLFIGGKGLAEGYYQMPQLTAEKFIPDPFHKNQKMYATGDFARFNEKGELECLGRQDGQVKVRGYRIELGEIESVLSKMNSIKSNATIIKEVRASDVRIIAFIVPDPKHVFNESEVRNLLNEKIPKYMIPSHFVVLEQLPQTLNGKIDKRALADLFTQTQHLPVEAKPHSASVNHPSSIEEELRSIWQCVLDVSSVSDNDEFFNIGGNSLLAVQLFSQLAKRFQVNLPLSLLLEAGSFKAFAEAVRTHLPVNGLAQASTYQSLVPIKASGRKNPIFAFHGAGGNVLNYVSLVPAISQDRPLVGVQSLGLRQNLLFQTIEEMASNYIHEMKKFQTSGPYFLTGGSMGGMIALEVARQLMARGDEVEKLVMFDTFGPRENMKDFSLTDQTFIDRIKSSLGYRKKVIVHKLKMKLLNLLGIMIPLELRLFEVEMNNYQALWRYRPENYAGDLHLIRARSQNSGWYSDPHMGWGQIVKGAIHTFEIDGNHSDFIESPELKNVFKSLQ